MNDSTPLPRTLGELLAREPTLEEREHRADDLAGRARLVRSQGWDEFRYTWSTGEVVGVALVLEDHAVLNAVADTETAALDTWAANLWGITGGETDASSNYAKTRRWFGDVRATVEASASDRHAQ